MIQYNFEQVKNKHNGKIAFVCVNGIFMTLNYGS